MVQDINFQLSGLGGIITFNLKKSFLSVMLHVFYYVISISI